MRENTLQALDISTKASSRRTVSAEIMALLREVHS